MTLPRKRTLELVAALVLDLAPGNVAVYLALANLNRKDIIKIL